jgi:hypothetical protein
MIQISDNEKQAEAMHRGIVEGIRKAVLKHKKAGQSIPVWRNGRVEEIPADQIEVEDKD